MFYRHDVHHHMKEKEEDRYLFTSITHSLSGFLLPHIYSSILFEAFYNSIFM